MTKIKQRMIVSAAAALLILSPFLISAQATNTAPALPGIQPLIALYTELIQLLEHEITFLTGALTAGVPPCITTCPAESSPNTPTNLVATVASSSEIDLSWTVSTNNAEVANYKVFRNGTFIAAPTTATYADTGLSASTMYTYFVEAVDISNNVSTASASVNATTSKLQSASSTSNVTATVIGPPEVVYEYATQKCATWDVPDLPTTAFRDAQGNVNLIVTNGSAATYRTIGTSLNTVQHQCNVIYSSHNDTTFTDFKYHEWMSGTYTLDGKTVYALIHNEWYGSLVNPQCAKPLPIYDDWVNAITMAVSTDGGATFSQPSDYIVRNPTTPWSNSFTCTEAQPTRYGDINGDNIFSKDGYYYYFGSSRFLVGGFEHFS